MNRSEEFYSKLIKYQSRCKLCAFSRIISSIDNSLNKIQGSTSAGCQLYIDTSTKQICSVKEGFQIKECMESKQGSQYIKEASRSFKQASTHSKQASYSFQSTDSKKLNRQILRKNMQLQQTVHLQSIKIKNMEDILEKFQSQIDKVNLKKHDGLSMLAQDIDQKNQQIRQLEDIIQIYEAKFDADPNKVLSSEVRALQSRIEQLERINEKLQIDLDRNTGKISQAQRATIEMQRAFELKQAENEKLKEQLFSLQDTQQALKRQKEGLQQLEQTLMSKIGQLKTQQHKYNNLLRKFNEQQSVSELNQGLNSMQIEKNLKLELVLEYLYQIDVAEYPTNILKQMMDQQQFGVLTTLKQKFLQYELQIKKMKQQILLKQKQNQDQIMKIYNDQSQKSQTKIQNTQTIANGNDKTIKILQLQVEKKEQIEVISQLKNKLMHIRDIILKLLKSLQIKSIKRDTSQILNLLFRVFEYSQQERNMIFAHLQPKERDWKVFSFL